MRHLNFGVGVTLVISGFAGGVDGKRENHLMIQLPKFQTGTFRLSDAPGLRLNYSRSVWSSHSRDHFAANAGRPQSEIEVSVERLDDQETVLQGTFSAVALGDPEGQVRMTNGKFRLKISGPDETDGASVALRAAIAMLEATDVGQRSDAIMQLRHRGVREVTAAALGMAGDRRAAAGLIRALHDEYANVQINAATSLADLGAPEAMTPLLDLLRSENQSVRAAAAGALGRLGDERARDGLPAMVRAEERWEIPLVRGLEALSKLGHPGAKMALEEHRKPRVDWWEWWERNKGELLD